MSAEPTSPTVDAESEFDAVADELAAADTVEAMDDSVHGVAAAAAATGGPTTELADRDAITKRHQSQFRPYAEETDLPYGLAGVQRHKDGGMQFTNAEEIAKQKGVLTHLLKTMGQNLLQGKSIINISLPVTIFEPRSFLQRVTDVWCYAPLFLTAAALATDPVERMKYVITFVFSGLHRGTKQSKPFNPILGETYQAEYSDGSRLSMEQISHHPPITAFQMYGPDRLFHFWGNHEYRASFRPNGVLGGQHGPTVVDFFDGTRIAYNMPQALLGGTIMGDRTFNFKTATPMVFVDQKNNLRADVSINPDALGSVSSLFFSAKSLSDTVRGEISHLRDPKADAAVAAPKQKLRRKSVTKPLVVVGGSWCESIKFDDKPYWTIGEFAAFSPSQDKYSVDAADPTYRLLPTDCTLREDLVALRDGDLDKAGQWKTTLEERQRADRTLRKQGPCSSEAEAEGDESAAATE